MSTKAALFLASPADVAQGKYAKEPIKSPESEDLNKSLKSTVLVICATFHSSVVTESRPTLLGDSICGGTCWIRQSAYLGGAARPLMETPCRPTTTEVCKYKTVVLKLF